MILVSASGLFLNLDSLVYRVDSNGDLPNLTHSTPEHSSGKANVAFVMAAMKCGEVPTLCASFSSRDSWGVASACKLAMGQGPRNLLQSDVRKVEYLNEDLGDNSGI